MTTTEAAPEVGTRSTHLATGTLHPSDLNLRTTMDPDELERLVESVRSHGVLQPLVVRPHPRRAGEWEIIAGHRRHRAAVDAGLATVPAIARNLTDQDRDEIMLIENLQRADLDPVEEAAGYLRLVEHGHTVTDLAGRIGRSRQHVSKRLRLLELPGVAQRALSAGDITLGDAHELVELLDVDDFDAAAAHHGGDTDLAELVTTEYLDRGRWAAVKVLDKARTDVANVDVRNRWAQLEADDDTATADLTGDDPDDVYPLSHIYSGVPDDHDTLDCHAMALTQSWDGALSIEPACTGGWGAHRSDNRDPEWEARQQARRRHEDTILAAGRQLIADTDVEDLATVAIDIAARWLGGRGLQVLELSRDEVDDYVAESHANRVRTLAAVCLSLATEKWGIRNGSLEHTAAIEHLRPYVPDGFDFASDGTEEGDG